MWLRFNNMHEKIWDSLLLLWRSKVHTSSTKMIYSNPASDIVHLVKTTMYNQNNNI